MTAKQAPFIEMVSNQIVVIVHESDYKEKYPLGVTITHSHESSTGRTSVLSTYMGEPVPDNEQFYFDQLFYQLMGEDTEN